LENFDAIGRYRTKDGDRPVDATSEYADDNGGVIRLTGARDVAQFAIASPHGQRVFIEQLFHALAKPPVLAYGPDVLNRLRTSFVASGYNIQKLVIDIAEIAAFPHRGSMKNN